MARARNQGRRRRPARAVTLWDPVPDLGELDPIAPASDPTAVLRSLGDLPLPGQSAIAGRYVEAVVERAAGLATALAAASGLLAESPAEDPAPG